MASRVPLIEVSFTEEGANSLIPRIKGVHTQLQQILTPRLRKALRAFLEDIAQEAVNTADLKHRSGKLRKNVLTGVRAFGTQRFSRIKGGIFVDPWVAIHEHGGTIKPTRAKYLTLPLPAAMFPDGTPKRRGPKSWQSLGTYVWTSKAGTKFIVYNRKSGPRVFLYVLVDSVTLRQRLFVRSTFRKFSSVLMAEWGHIIMDGYSRIDMASLIEPNNRTPRQITTKQGPSRLFTLIKILSR